MGKLRSRVGRTLRETGVIHAHPDGFAPRCLDQLTELLAPIERRLDELAGQLPGAESDVLNSYCSETPSPQTAVDIFAGEWASALPAPLECVRAGSAPLFAIEHVPWGVDVLGGSRASASWSLVPWKVVTPI